MSTRTILSTVGRLVLGGACVISSACGGELMRTGRSPVFLTVESMSATPGGGGAQGSFLLSDVQVLVDQTVNGVTTQVPTIFNDNVTAVLRSNEKNPSADGDPDQRRHADALSRRVPPHGRTQYAGRRRAVRFRRRVGRDDRARLDRERHDRDRSPPGEAGTSTQESRQHVAARDSSRPLPKLPSTAAIRTAMRSPSSDGSMCSLAILATRSLQDRIIMRTTTYVSLLGAAALAAVAGCTVKDVDQPALAGPSTFANSITMVADRDTLTQNGVDFTDIRITALGPDGQALTSAAARPDLRGRRPERFRHAEHEDPGHADDRSLYRATRPRR